MVNEDLLLPPCQLFSGSFVVLVCVCMCFLSSSFVAFLCNLMISDNGGGSFAWDMYIQAIAVGPMSGTQAHVEQLWLCVWAMCRVRSHWVLVPGWYNSRSFLGWGGQQCIPLQEFYFSDGYYLPQWQKLLVPSIKLTAGICNDKHYRILCCEIYGNSMTVTV